MKKILLVKRSVKIGENLTTKKKFPTGTGNTDGEQRKAMIYIIIQQVKYIIAPVKFQ